MNKDTHGGRGVRRPRPGVLMPRITPGVEQDSSAVRRARLLRLIDEMPGATQAELAAALGVRQPTVSKHMRALGVSLVRDAGMRGWRILR